MSVILRDISKRYGDKRVLENLCLTFTFGKRYAVVGTSGIGKTTLLRLIAGLEKQDDGSVEMQNDPVISYAFQEPRLFPGLTVMENIRAIDPERDGSQLLEMLDLLHESDHYPASLSGGMKKRAGLARALSKKADIYLIDEPTAGQDANHSAAVADAIRAYTAGSLCIISTHDAELIAAIAEEMIVFSNKGVALHRVAGKTTDEIRCLMQ